MRYGSPLSGVVEIGLLSAGAVQVAHYYDLPAEGFGPRTDSKALDEQAGIERAFVGILPALAGAEIVSGAGCVEAVATFSIEQLLIDNEFYGMMFRMLRGISFDKDRLAVDVIMRVGPAGNLLKDISTVKYYRTEFFLHDLFDKRDRRSWEASGSKSVEQVANEKARKILLEHEPSPLTNEEKRKLDSLVKDFEKSRRP
jgi:trimethylamine--corrinoid protein Co-methyltransferase